MEENNVRRGECQETSGFLFSHTCGDFANKRCAQCDKEICNRHMVNDTSTQNTTRIVCTTCAKTLLGPPSERANRSHQHGSYYDDPYFYTHYYYPDYSLGNDEFTDSDEAAVGSASAAHDLETFEDDMGAS